MSQRPSDAAGPGLATAGEAVVAGVGNVPTGAEWLVDFCLSLAWSTLEEPVRARSRELVLDHLGVVLAAVGADSSRALYAALEGVPATGEATVPGGPACSPEWAALANGTLAHTLELDDCTRESSLHPGVTVIPAALAAAEAADADAATFFEGVVGGYEVAMRVGAALNPGSAYRRGFHPTGVAGVFGAAMAVGRILGLSRPHLVSALGIAGTMASGSLEYLSTGAWTKRLNAGWAAHAGFMAARLAAAGFVGPSTILEGPLGVLRAYSDRPAPELLAVDPGDPPSIMRVALKPFACCRYAHGVIDAMLALRSEEGLVPDAVTGIELGILSIATDLVAEPIDRKRAPSSIVDAQFSAPFAAAVALVHGNAGLDEFTVDTLGDERVRQLMAVTDCFTDDALDDAFPASMPAIVRVATADGRRLERRVDFPSGEPENPLPGARVLERFGRHARTLLEPESALDLGTALLNLSGSERIRSVIEPIRRAGPHRPARPVDGSEPDPVVVHRSPRWGGSPVVTKRS